MMEVTNRELASAIVFTAVVLALILSAKNRRDIWTSFGGLARAYFARSIQTAILCYFLYVGVVVWSAWGLGLWSIALLKDTLITAVFVGFPLAMSANKIRSGAKLVSDTIKDTISLSAFLFFYLGIESLDLWAEILLQIVVGFFALMTVVAEREARTRKVAAFSNVILLLIAVWLIIAATLKIASNWGSYDAIELLLSLALSIWLPLALIPLVYYFAVAIHVDSAVSMLSFYNDRKTPPIRVRTALVLGLRFSARQSAAFVGPWRTRVARTRSFRDATAVMRKFRKSLVEAQRAEKKRLARLERHAGVSGVDSKGRQLDRREFGATKKVLTKLFNMQMGWNRNRLGHFKDDMLEILGDTAKDGLPLPNGIHLRVRKDKQKWYAWRETAGGRVFAVGGTKNLENEWQFDGQEPPTRFPGKKKAEWRNVARKRSSREWRTNDEPIAVSSLSSIATRGDER
jgi:hypothetical protein